MVQSPGIDLEGKKRPMRVKVYEVIDELNVLDTKVWKRLQSQEVRRQFKKVKELVNSL